MVSNWDGEGERRTGGGEVVRRRLDEDFVKLTEKKVCEVSVEVVRGSVRVGGGARKQR